MPDRSLDRTGDSAAGAKGKWEHSMKKIIIIFVVILLPSIVVANEIE
jgi:hypothetical protein